MNNNNKEEISKVVAGIEALKLTNGNLIKQLEDIERRLNYKRFYFPGVDTRLYVEGEGLDNENVHYVNEWYSPCWDPRFVEDYINHLKTYGYEKHVIYYDPINDTFLSRDYDDIYEIFKTYWDVFNREVMFTNNVTEQINYESCLSSAIASLLYFDKYDDFKQDMSAPWIDDITETLSTSSYIKKLEKYIGKTREEFITNNYGYFSPKTLAFDAEQELEEYNKYQKEYEEYKTQLWNWLSGIQNLQLCASSISGIVQASGASSITIEQYNNCVMELEDGLNTNDNVVYNDSATGDNYVVNPETDEIVDVVPTPNEYKPLTETKNDTLKIIYIIVFIFSVFMIMFCFVLLILKKRQINIQNNVI